MRREQVSRQGEDIGRPGLMGRHRHTDDRHRHLGIAGKLHGYNGQPVACPRSSTGNQAAMAFMPAGKLPASLSPNTMRARIKPPTVAARACPMEARVQSRAAPR